MKSMEEMWLAILFLTTAELLRLEHYARWRIRWLGRKALGRDERDLLQEAITATVTGKRVWKEDVDLCLHLLGAMRSISSSWHEKKGDEYLESELAEPGQETPLDRAATTEDPERILRAKERLEEVKRLFAQDAAASKIIKLLGFGHTAKEIQSELRLSATEYATVTKRIRRKLQRELACLDAASPLANLESKVSVKSKEFMQV